MVEARPRRGHAAASTFFDQFRKNRPLATKAKGQVASGPTAVESPLSGNKWGSTLSISLQTAANIIRKNMGLRQERLARLYPTIDHSHLKPVKPRLSTRDDPDLKLRAKAIKLAVAEYLSNSRKVGYER